MNKRCAGDLTIRATGEWTYEATLLVFSEEQDEWREVPVTLDAVLVLRPDLESIIRGWRHRLTDGACTIGTQAPDQRPGRYRWMTAEERTRGREIAEAAFAVKDAQAKLDELLRTSRAV